MLKQTPVKIGIIGGGYTGLTAAYELTKQGVEVEILEKFPVLGGLAAEFEIEDEPLEKAYHHLFRTDTHILELLSELGLGEKLEWHKSSLAVVWKNRQYPFMTPLDLLRFSPLRIWNRIRAGLVVLYLQKTTSWKKFVNVTALNWMGRAAGSQVMEVIWRPLLIGKFSKFADQISMSWLWARIHVRANSRIPGKAGEYLAYPKGGFRIITQALESAIQSRGGSIITGIQINSIRSNNGKVEVETDQGLKQYDKLLVTTPTHVFANLAGEELTIEDKQGLQSVDYLGAVVMVFSSSQPLSSFYWHNINDLKSPFLVFIQHTNLITDGRYGGQHVYYIGTYVPHEHEYFEMLESEISTKWFNHLQTIFPHFSREEIRQQHIFKFKYAQHVVDTEYESKIQPYKTKIPGVYLANFSQIFPEDRGTNFAVREGQKLARMMLE